MKKEKKSNFHKSDLAALFVPIFRKNELCNHNLIFLKIKQKGLIVAVLPRSGMSNSTTLTGHLQMSLFRIAFKKENRLRIYEKISRIFSSLKLRTLLDAMRNKLI